MPQLPIIHWNDVYRVTPQKVSSTSKDTIDVTQFGAMLEGIKEQWPKRRDGKRDGLLLFSGDVFSPSVESSVTRGSHMVPVMNELAPDVSMTGNHDFDFGYPHLSKLIQDTSFPWLLSNVIDNSTQRVPEFLKEFHILDRVGIRIGIIGLIEKEWISTVSAWPSGFEYRDMTEVGQALSKKLRDPQGEYKCDFVIALTHARLPNDIALAKHLLALSPSAQEKAPIYNSHGVDLLLGGHDHLYYVSKGVTSWENYDTTQEVLGAEGDHGDILVVKSGTDFRDLSEITLDLEAAPVGSVRSHIIKSIKGKWNTTKPGSKSSERLTELLKTLLSSVSESLKAPVCQAGVPIDVRSQFIRTTESAAGNWLADIIRHSYDDALCMKGCGGSDGVFICAGTLRGDSVYGPGRITLGDIMEILPFEDPIIVLELDGMAIWDALEASLITWPAQEGRFPIVSGFRVSWDSRREPGNRVLGVWLVNEIANSEHGHDVASGHSTPKLVDGEEIKREINGRKYKIVSREYMAQGHDGFLPLKGQKYLIDDECGQMFSTLVRRYFLGSQFINKMARLADLPESKLLHHDTKQIVRREQARRERVKRQEPQSSTIAQKWKHAASLALHRSRAHYQDHINISNREDMSDVDPVDGKMVRSGKVGKIKGDEAGAMDEDLITVSPVIDGRLKDEGRN